MNRKQRVITVTGHGFALVSGIEEEQVTFYSLTNFIGEDGDKVKFARRPFVGAERVDFTFIDDGIMDMFIAHVGNAKIEICADAAIGVLEVSEKTKKFSIWYKRA